MQIVIDIPEKAYRQLKFLNEQGFGTVIDEAVANGTPLPKGHGRLIDADKFIENIKWTAEVTEDRAGYGCCMWSEEHIIEDVEKALTIIEADKESEE